MTNPTCIGFGSWRLASVVTCLAVPIVLAACSNDTVTPPPPPGPPVAPSTLVHFSGAVFDQEMTPVAGAEVKIEHLTRDCGERASPAVVTGSTGSDGRFQVEYQHADVDPATLDRMLWPDNCFRLVATHAAGVDTIVALSVIPYNGVDDRVVKLGFQLR